MLTLNQQVTSLALSKRLKELGVRQRDCLFAHYFNAGEPTDCIVDAPMYKDMDDDYWEAKLVSAFTVAELGEMLPVRTQTGRRKQYTEGKPVWYCNYSHKNGDMTHQEDADTEADARAKMLIYLLENKLITL